MDTRLERSAIGEQWELFPFKKCIKILYHALICHFATCFPFGALEAMLRSRYQKTSKCRQQKKIQVHEVLWHFFPLPSVRFQWARWVWETNFKCHSHQNTIIFSIKYKSSSILNNNTYTRLNLCCQFFRWN